MDGGGMEAARTLYNFDVRLCVCACGHVGWHDIAVGHGIELPTRMHYFERGVADTESKHGASITHLRRVPVMNFEHLRETWDKRSPNDRMFNEELEDRRFDRSPNQLNPRTVSKGFCIGPDAEESDAEV